jgi:hypothetical protein
MNYVDNKGGPTSSTKKDKLDPNKLIDTELQEKRLKEVTVKESSIVFGLQFKAGKVTDDFTSGLEVDAPIATKIITFYGGENKITLFDYDEFVKNLKKTK